MKPHAAALSICVLLSGCTSLVASLPEERLRFNEAIKIAAEEQMLLNIVRLRYTDTPSSLTVSSIAMQSELQRGVGLIPFFGVAASVTDIRGLAGVVPGGQVQSVDRPTVTLTPLDDQDFTRRLFTPMSPDGVLYLARTTWPIAIVFRLWVENLNWVSNAQSGSGPIPPQGTPDYLEFQRGIAALQVLQDRGHVFFTSEEREETVGGAIPAARVSGGDLVAAVKEGMEYRRSADGRSFTLVKKRRVAVMRLNADARDSPEMREVFSIFRLRRGLAKFEIEQEKNDPYLRPADGYDSLDLETRSLLQVLYFVSKGVEVPAEHLRQGIAVSTLEPTGKPFDWSQVTRGLFRVASSNAEKPPATAHAAVKYQGHWFFIDKRDADTMSTFSLLVELARLELPGRSTGPVFTLPLGGR